MAHPRLSVVIAIVDGGDALRRCLSGVFTQVDPPTMEVLVPVDASIREATSVIEEFTGARIVDMGDVTTGSTLASSLGGHELFGRRRAAGLSEARGSVVALLEDRVVPRPEWSRAVIRAHESGLGRSVIGGAVENGVDRPLHWAVYYCDYGRYQLPFGEGPRDYATDVNLSYTRDALERTRELWREGYEETTVNWALANDGAGPHLVPTVVVDQIRGPLRLGALLRERFHWGRAFARSRAAGDSLPRRFVRVATTPALPLLLLARVFQQRWRRRAGMRAFMTAAPAALLLFCAWSAGEAVGSLAPAR